MTRPNVFPCDTTLYHPNEGPRVFLAGDQDPGAAWSSKPGGDSIGAGTTAQALKDLIAAQDQLDMLGDQYARQTHDLAQAVKTRDEAVGATSALKQAVADAQAAQKVAEDIAAGLTAERDAARAEAQALRASLAAMDGDGDGKPGGTMAGPDAASDGSLPENWRELHWTRRVKLAKSLGASPDTDTDTADAFLAGLS